MKKVKCTKCNSAVKLDDMIINDQLVKRYGEGCTYFGHIISEKHYEELKHERNS